MPVLTILQQAIQLLKKYLIPLILVVLLLSTVLLYKQNKKLNTTVNNKLANIEAYQGIINNLNKSNNVLKLDMEDLDKLNDKLLNEIDSIRNKMKIKPGSVQIAAGINQTIDTTASVSLPPKIVLVKDSCKLDKTINFNAQTSVHIKLLDSLKVSLSVHNLQVLFIENKRQYKHKKNFIKRLFTLDFKKVTVATYDIYNTNDLIKVDSTRVVEETKEN